MSKVLVVDDSPESRDLMNEILSRYEVQEIIKAATGEEAIEKYREAKPDVVLLDLILPEMDGIEVLKQIISMDNDAKVIMITGREQEDIKEKCINAGAKDYLLKPFSPKMIWKKVKENL